MSQVSKRLILSILLLMWSRTIYLWKRYIQEGSVRHRQSKASKNLRKIVGVQFFSHMGSGEKSSYSRCFVPGTFIRSGRSGGHHCRHRRATNQLDDIFDAIDSDIVKLRQDVRDWTLSNVYANQLKSLMSQLSVNEDLVYLDGARIGLSNNAVIDILPLFYTSHIGMNKSYKLCRSLYFWPGMFNDISQMISQCNPCNVHKPYQPKKTKSTLPPSSYLGPPMGHVGLDLLSLGVNSI